MLQLFTRDTPKLCSGFIPAFPMIRSSALVYEVAQSSELALLERGTMDLSMDLPLKGAVSKSLRAFWYLVS